MKRFSVLMAAGLIGSALWSGCGKTEEAPPPPPTETAMPETPASAPMPAVETPKAPETMVDLVASAKAGVEQAMALAKEGKYQEALTLLQQKASEVQSNPEAKKVIDDAMAKIKQMMNEAASKAVTDKVGGLLK